MPVIQRHLRPRYLYNNAPAAVSNEAIVISSICSGCMLIFIIWLFVCLRPRVQRRRAALQSAGGSATGALNSQGTPLGAVGRGLIESRDPPMYQVPEPTYQQNDMPPAYESTAVWPGRPTGDSPMVWPTKPAHKWTTVWPFRSTSNA